MNHSITKIEQGLALVSEGVKALKRQQARPEKKTAQDIFNFECIFKAAVKAAPDVFTHGDIEDWMKVHHNEQWKAHNRRIGMLIRAMVQREDVRETSKNGKNAYRKNL